MSWTKSEWILSVGALIAAMALFFTDIRGTFPVDRWDELMYFAYSRSNWLEPSWSVIYLGWYRFLNLFLRDPIQLHFTNAVILSSALAGTIFFTLTRLRVRPLLALLGGIWAILWVQNSGSTMKVNHFSVIALLLAAAVVNSYKITLDKKCLSFGVICLYLVYARVENLPVAILFLQLFLGLYCVAPYKPDRFIFIHCAFMAVAVALFAFFSPFQRGWEAFIDHYYWVYRPDVYGPANAPTASLPQIAQFARDNNELSQIMFPGARSTVEAILVNPQAVFAAFKFRLVHFISEFPSYNFSHFSLFSVTDRVNAFVIFLENLFIAGLLLVLALTRKNNYWHFFRDNAFFLLLFGALLVKLIFLCIVVNPAPRYVLDLFVVFTLLLITIPGQNWNRTVSPWITLPALIIMLLFFPRTGTFSIQNSPLSDPTNADQKLALSAVAHIKEMNKKRNLRQPNYFADMFYPELASTEPPKYYNLFLTPVELVPKSMAEFSKFFRDRGTDIIVVDQKKISDIKYSHRISDRAEVLKNFSDSCYEVTLKNSYVTVQYLRPECATGSQH